MMQTNWGYSILEYDHLSELLTIAEYVTLTGRHDDEGRVITEIAAAGTAIRNYVGWHLAPQLACRMTTTAYDRRVARVGDDLMIQLPARYVSEVESIKINGVECEEYDLDPSGILTIYDAPYMVRHAGIVVDYTAGLPGSLIYPLQELVAHRVTHALAVPAGITSEAAGGVSVTYNANWINNSSATALIESNKELLVPYKLQGVY